MIRGVVLRTGIAPVCTSLLLLTAGCGGSGDGPGVRPPPVTPPPPPPATGAAIERVYPLLAFNRPVAMLQAPGDDNSRWYVVEQAGVVRTFPNDADVASSSVFLDIVMRVDSSPNEGGLLGLAFDPDFSQNGFVYASYTAPGPFRSVVSRFELAGGASTIDAATEQVLLEVPQPLTNHNGGHIVFGPDGFLYVGLGDGGGAGDPEDNGQDRTTLLGAILRIDVSTQPYSIPGGNPFAGNTECFTGSGTDPCPEIYAWGLRNPWRFSFDTQNGDLWIGDVGQNQREEINRAEGGEDFGWNEREGTLCFDPPANCSLMNTDPITEYDRGLGQSVTGGYVYRGNDFPTLSGQYLFGDFVSGRIWRVPADAEQGAAPVELARTPLSISSFGQDSDGEVFVVDYSGGLFRLVVP